jgi:hypothetical protein
MSFASPTPESSDPAAERRLRLAIALTGRAKRPTVRLLREIGMPSVIEELSGEDGVLDHARISARVVDWQTRIVGLYAEITSWFPDLRADRTGTVGMNEQVMQAYDVAPVRLPVLRLLAGPDQVAKFVPHGLWIIGTNGRLDLFAAAQFVIVDRSETFTSPRWEIAPALRRRQAEPFTREALLRAIA